MPERYKVLSPGFDYAAGDGRAFAVQGQVIEDAPQHGTGRCAADCGMKGDHDWLLTGGGGAPVLALEAEPLPELKKKGGK